MSSLKHGINSILILRKAFFVIVHFVTGEPKQTPVQDTIFKNIEAIFIIESQTRMIIIVNFVTRTQKQIPNTCTIFKIMIITFNIVNLHQKKLSSS